MSRQFSTGAGTDSITFDAGGAPPDEGPITVAVLAKAFSTAGWTGWMVAAKNTGTSIWGTLTTNNAGAKLFAENDFGNGVAGLSTSWQWYVMTKASGAAKPRWHVWDLSGTWSHTDGDANVGDGTGPIDTIFVGSQNGSSNGWRGSIAVVATWAADLSTGGTTDAAVEAAMTLSAADTFNTSPDWMIRLNQASTATSVTDDTGGGGDQSAISGTSVDADDPPGFDYSLTPPSFETTLTAGPTVALTLAGQVVYDTTVTAGPAVSLTLAGQVVYDTTVSMGVSAALSARGALGATIGQGVSQGLTLAGSVTHGMTMGLTCGVTLDGTVTGGHIETPSGWNTIMGAVNEARAEHQRHRDRERHPLDCPVHLWPLQPLGGNRYHCQFGGHVVRGR